MLGLGNKADNSPMECFFINYNSEWMPKKGYTNFNETKNDLIQYIVNYYADVRPHKHNGNITPNKSEQIYWENYKGVANNT